MRAVGSGAVHGVSSLTAMDNVCRVKQAIAGGRDTAILARLQSRIEQLASSAANCSESMTYVA